MRFAVLAIASCLLLFPCFSAHAGENGEDVSARIMELTRMVQEETQHSRELIRKDEQELRQELNRLESELEAQKQALSSARDQFQSLRQQERKLREEKQREQEEVEKVGDIAVEAAGQAGAIFDRSLVSPKGQGQRADRMHEMASSQDFLDMAEIEELVGALQTEMRKSGEISVQEREFTGPEGGRLQGEIHRIGALTAVYDSPQAGIGYLTSDPEVGLKAVTTDPPWLTHRSLSSYLQGDSESLPLDLSAGAVFDFWSERRDLGEWIQAGGVIIWPILLIGFSAFVLAGERFLFLLRIRSGADRMMDHITALAEEAKWQEGREHCRRNWHLPASRVLDAVLRHVDSTRNAAENSVQDSLLQQVPRLERFISTLSVLAAISPLLGLLGTVTGMIGTFEVITLFGTGDPELMSGGISEALITTQVGLAVAIPIMLLHHLLDRRVERIVSDTEEKGNSLVLLLLRQGNLKQDRD